MHQGARRRSSVVGLLFVGSLGGCLSPFDEQLLDAAVSPVDSATGDGGADGGGSDPTPIDAATPDASIDSGLFDAGLITERDAGTDAARPPIPDGGLTPRDDTGTPPPPCSWAAREFTVDMAAAQEVAELTFGTQGAGVVLAAFHASTPDERCAALGNGTLLERNSTTTGRTIFLWERRILAAGPHTVRSPQVCDGPTTLVGVFVEGSLTCLPSDAQATTSVGAASPLALEFDRTTAFAPSVYVITQSQGSPSTLPDAVAGAVYQVDGGGTLGVFVDVSREPIQRNMVTSAPWAAITAWY